MYPPFTSTDRVVYTQWLDKHGQLQGDVTVTKLSPTSFLVIVTDSMHRHAEAHLRGQALKSPHIVGLFCLYSRSILTRFWSTQALEKNGGHGHKRGGGG